MALDCPFGHDARVWQKDRQTDRHRFR